ncbi:hypothetical protein MHA_1859 [Mannheimia haemolytica PHL213]|nr:hypothetical protein MHA_1859 [Mannheimia haemolytica PHL213]
MCLDCFLLFILIACRIATLFYGPCLAETILCQLFKF